MDCKCNQLKVSNEAVLSKIMELKIIKDNDGDYTLEQGRGYVGLIINYCPMCGRKLKED